MGQGPGLEQGYLERGVCPGGGLGPSTLGGHRRWESDLWGVLTHLGLEPGGHPRGECLHQVSGRLVLLAHLCWGLGPSVRGVCRLREPGPGYFGGVLGLRYLEGRDLWATRGMVRRPQPPGESLHNWARCWGVI